jgi:hypothetical protein
MPNTYWTITRLARNDDDDDVVLTVAQWGIEQNSLRRSLRQRAVSELRFRAIVEDFTAAGVFEMDDILIVRKGVQIEDDEITAGSGSQWFYGIVTEIPRASSAGNESLDYVVSDSFHWLVNTVFQQQTYVWDGTYQAPLFAIANFVPVDTSHVLLPYARSMAAWGVLTCEEQIREACRWVIEELSVADRAPLQLGTIEIDPDGYDGGTVPVTEDVDVTCAQVITKMLRWTPDAVAWIDHTTTPPTFHCRRWNALPSVSLAIGAGLIVSMDITPLHHLTVPGVLLRFEKLNTVSEDGEQSSALVHSTQKYPAEITGRELGCLIQTINLYGQNKTVQTVDITAPPIEANSANAATRLAWWTARDDFFTNPFITDVSVTFTSVESDDELALPRELAEGQIPEWLIYDAADNPNGVQSEQAVFHAKVKCKVWNDLAHTGTPKADHTAAGKELERTLRIQTTNATTRRYTNEEITQYQEPEPAGLARFIYEGLSVLHYSGAIQITEQKIADRITLGQRLNLTGGRAEWATMNAMVVSIEDDVGSGTTTVRFGPPQYLTAQEFVDFLRTNRDRVRSMSLNLPQTGRFSGGSSVNAAKILPVRNATSGPVPGGSGGNFSWG